MVVMKTRKSRRTTRSVLKRPERAACARKERSKDGSWTFSSPEKQRNHQQEEGEEDVQLKKLSEGRQENDDKREGERREHTSHKLQEAAG